MKKKTLGGKRKLVFVPNIPARDLEEQGLVELENNSIGAKEIWVDQEEKVKSIPKTKTRREKFEANDTVRAAALIGNVKETNTFINERVKEIYDTDISKIENGPIVLPCKELIDKKDKEIYIQQDSMYLLQVPKLLPEEGSQYIRGKLRIDKEGKATLILFARKNKNMLVDENIFTLDVCKIQSVQEAFVKSSKEKVYNKIDTIKEKILAKTRKV